MDVCAGTEQPITVNQRDYEKEPRDTVEQTPCFSALLYTFPQLQNCSAYFV